MSSLFNRVRMSTTTTGTGTITLGSATSNAFFTFAEAGVGNGAVVSYVIEDGTDVEFGIGTYTVSGTTLSRDTVTASKISGTAGTSKISLSGSAVVFIDALAGDLPHAGTATEGTPAAGDFVALVRAEGDMRLANWNTLPGAGAGISNVSEDTTPELGGVLESNNFDVHMENFAASNVATNIFFQKSRNASIGAHTAVQADDDLGSIHFYGSDGTNFEIAAAIVARVGGTPGDNDMPGKLQFFTTADGSVSATMRVQIDSSGHMHPGTNDGGQLGVTGTAWSDLFLAEGGAINWDSSEVTLTQSGVTLTLAGCIFFPAEINPTARIIENEVNLSDGANVTLNSSLGNTFKLVAGGDRTIDAPTNKPAAGKVQKIVIMHEASGAGRTLTLATGSAGAFRFGTNITALTATSSGLVDYIGCIYNDADDRWDVVSYVKGF
jgi:hypothetical protein